MKKIKDLYYTIWVDCITRVRNFDDFWWEYKCMMILSFAMGVSFMVFMAVIQRTLGFSLYNLDLTNFLIKPIASLVSSFILFFLPFLLLNYVLIFYNRRYEILIKKYKYYNGKYAMTFFLFSMVLPILSFILLIIFNKVVK